MKYSAPNVRLRPWSSLEAESPAGPPRRLRLATVLPMVAAGAWASLIGCHSPYVAMTVHNAGAQPVSLIEVDYPDASFGIDALAAGASYRYSFQILGSGPTKISWTDASRKSHTSAGPELQEGQQGTLRATLNGKTAIWQASIRSH